MPHDTLQRLFARRRFGMDPGLDRIQALLARLDHPERNLAAIHVAGTNGKGSVATLVASVLDAAGFGVGRYTSPHLVHFNERIVIRGEPVADAPLAESLTRVESVAADVARAGGGEATFFECATAAGFDLFSRAGVRLAVIEAGLGGRLDATNVLTPLVATITRIGLEHCEQLGTTLAAIAGEKAGIIKPGRPVVIGAMPDEARDAIRRVAARQGAALVDATERVVASRPTPGLEGLALNLSSDVRDLGRVHLGLAGAYQAENAATALAVLDTIAASAGLEISDDACRAGFRQARWPGRFDLVQRDPPVLVDGAHNPDAAAALRAALHASRFRGPIGLVAGFCGDKDIAALLRILAPIVRRAWAVETPSPRTLPATATAEQMRLAGIDARASDLTQALAEAGEWARAENGLVLVCGSLFLAGEVLARFGKGPGTAASDARPPDPNELLNSQ